MNVSRRLIQSEFLLDNLAQQKFTDYGMGTIPLDTTIIDRIKTLIKNKGQSGQGSGVSKTAPNTIKVPYFLK